MWSPEYKKRLYILQLTALSYAWKHESQYNLLLVKNKQINYISYGITILFFIIGGVSTSIEQTNSIWFVVIAGVLMAFLKFLHKFKDDSGLLQNVEIHRKIYDEFNYIADDITKQLELPEDMRIPPIQYIESITQQINKVNREVSNVHLDPIVIEEWEALIKMNNIKHISIIDNIKSISIKIDEIAEEKFPSIQKPPLSHNTTFGVLGSSNSLLIPANPEKTNLTIYKDRKASTERRRYELERIQRFIHHDMENSQSSV
jgi:hypothetical protein